MGIIAVLLYSQGYLGSKFYVPFSVVIACQAAIALGTLFGGWRIVHTMGSKITRLTPVQGCCAETGGSIMLLQAGENEIDIGEGKFSVKNSGREVSLFEVAERAVELKRQGVITESLDTQAGIKVPPSFPNGCHIAEVEIDPSTGAVEIVSYIAVDDCGNVLDYTIVEAQIHGGVAQGLGQALTENTIYDAGGQLVSGSFMIESKRPVLVDASLM